MLRFPRLWLFSLFFLALPVLAKDLDVRGEKGEIDIGSWDFKQNGHLMLQGEWLFYWNRYLGAEDIRQLRFLKETSLVVVAPGTFWNSLPAPVQPRGFAAYAMKLKGLSQQKFPLSFVMGQFMGTHETWIYWPRADHLQKLGSSGRISRTEEQFIPHYKRQAADLDTVDEDEAWVVVNYATFIIEGGLPATPTLFDRAIWHKDERHHDWEVFWVLGMFGMLVLTHLALYVLRRDDKASLMMSSVAFLMIMRFIGTEGLFFEVLPDPNYILSYAYMVSVVNLPPLTFCAYFEFLFRSFPGYISRRAVTISWILTLLLSTGNVYDMKHAMILTLSLWFCLVPIGIWLFYGVFQAFRQGDRSSMFALTGIMLFVLSAFFDFLVYMNFVSFRYMGQYGMLCFLFMQSLVVAYNFGLAFRTAERLSLNLQQEVDQQTLKLRMQKDKLEEQKRELVLAHEALREADAQKTRFFRSISHELRTPLTLILGSLPSAERSQGDKKSLEVVRRNASRLFRLVNQLLDFQKVALSQTRLRLEEIDLAKFLQGMAPYFISACQEKGIHFAVKLPQRSPEKILIMAQADALEKIIFNYLANALKFTGNDGHITLELIQAQGRARITVSDDGPGIPEKEQDKLFKLFSQIEGPHQKEQQGTGLGLALVKELAQHMSGNVGLVSQEGEGAAFWVEFPSLSAQDHIDLLILDREAASWERPLQKMRERGWLGQYRIVEDAYEVIRMLSTHQLRALVCSAQIGPELESVLLSAGRLRHFWKALIGSPGEAPKNLQAEAIDAWFESPDSEGLITLLLEHAAVPQDPDRPILDLIYIEDDTRMQEEVFTALGTYTLIEHIKVVARGEELKALMQQYRVRVVIADARLEGERGTDLLAFVARTSPDTFRILLTGEHSQATLAAGITDAQAHYIIYKPADLAKEARVIEGYVTRSTIQASLPKDGYSATSKEWQLAGLEGDSVADSRLGKLSNKPVANKATILVVDDVHDMRVMISSILQSQDFHVLHAANGLQAFEMLQSRQVSVDVIVTDWLMPQLSGPDLIARLRASEDLASIPTILLTAKTDSESKAYGTMVGASAYVGKPFDEMELLSTVDNLLDLKKRERKIEELNRFIATHVLQRFLPPDLVEDLVAGKARFEDAAQLRTVTVLFADLCGFTQWTERLGPERIARILNSFLVRMTDVIFSEGGTIDKFMGDGILVIFGAPRTMDAAQQAQAAARCARHMQEALAELNGIWQDSEGMTFQMRIGIHHGPAIVGSFGGERRSDYTAVGNTVNIASRVETCAQPGEILVTPAVIAFLTPKQCQSAGDFKLKGIEGAMELFRLLYDEGVDQGAA